MFFNHFECPSAYFFECPSADFLDIDHDTTFGGRSGMDTRSLALPLIVLLG
jgi:hypothetical protein